MEMYDFTYALPNDFDNRVCQLLRQLYKSDELANAFANCKYEYEDLGLAYYAGLRGDNWNKNAIDMTIEGPQSAVSVLKNNNKTVENAISKALKSTETGLLLRDTVYLTSDSLSVFPETNEERLNADIQSAELVLSDLIKVGERLCSNPTYNGDSSENSINDFFRDTLSLMGYNEVKDQTRHGISNSGKGAGEVDILITKDGKEVAIYEGLKLSSVNTSYIDNHIEKSIVNYNALGTATFIIAYVSTYDYANFFNRYFEHLQNIQFPMETKQALKVSPFPNASTRLAKMILSRDGYDFPVYFVTFKLLNNLKSKEWILCRDYIPKPIMKIQ